MKYENPILFGDYSDPDVIRVGDSFYMISSSFTFLPGIPVLRSKDLVNWSLIGYAASRLPFERYAAPAHKRGTWAPSIRYHGGRFYVYVCLPDEGLLCFTAEDPSGEWECHIVKRVCGWIDPCPLFDEDGNAYLVHALAASRVGINNMLFLHRLSANGLQVLDKGALVYNGADHGDSTTEGPKMYRRNGEYYILCPAGGVTNGYQLALRAKSPYGPYERRVVLSQGDTDINGPHQGGLVDDGRGADWFIHFQDAGIYGRVPRLEPVKWEDGWPVMGNGGFPVASGETAFPEVKKTYPEMSDAFIGGKLGLQWQFQCNPNPSFIEKTNARLRLRAVFAPDLYSAGQFLSQLMQRKNFNIRVFLTLNGQYGDMAGVGMMGDAYVYLALTPGRIVLVRGEVREIPEEERTVVIETRLASIPWLESQAEMTISVRDGYARFFIGGAPIGDACPLSRDDWSSARPGIFCMSSRAKSTGFADFEYCRVTDENGERA